jgi:hypothetical protein
MHQQQQQQQQQQYTTAASMPAPAFSLMEDFEAKIEECKELMALYYQKADAQKLLNEIAAKEARIEQKRQKQQNQNFSTPIKQISHHVQTPNAPERVPESERPSATIVAPPPNLPHAWEAIVSQQQQQQTTKQAPPQVKQVPAYMQPPPYKQAQQQEQKQAPTLPPNPAYIVVPLCHPCHHGDKCTKPDCKFCHTGQYCRHGYDGGKECVFSKIAKAHKEKPEKQTLPGQLLEAEEHMNMLDKKFNDPALKHIKKEVEQAWNTCSSFYKRAAPKY